MSSEHSPNKITDHREIGEKYKLFFFDKKLPGQAVFLPKGTIMMQMLKNIIRKVMIKNHYKEIISASFGLQEMWEKTKHMLKYSENIFFIDEQYVLKPMNCPMHMILAQKIYNQKSQLPIKLFEFNYCFRREKSGSTCGMFRLLRFTQDDSHVIQEMTQIENTVNIFITTVNDIYKKFNLCDIKFRLSNVESKDYVGTENQRIMLQQKLKNILEANNASYIEENDGAFYAPKIDIIVKDSGGREWQTGTIQLDTCLLCNCGFNLYNTHNTENVCVIHTAILGTFERFIAIVLEHNGKVPSIINPYQIAVIFIENDHEQNEILYDQILKNCSSLDSATIDIIQGTNIKQKVLLARKNNYEYIIVIGDKEIKSQKFTIKRVKDNKEKVFTFEQNIILNFEN